MIFARDCRSLIIQFARATGLWYFNIFLITVTVGQLLYSAIGRPTPTRALLPDWPVYAFNL
jgi:hypothetical protein